MNPHSALAASVADLAFHSIKEKAFSPEVFFLDLLLRMPAGWIAYTPVVNCEFLPMTSTTHTQSDPELLSW
jgi:hypothetical protein